MNYILFDDHSWENLLPLTFTKPIAELRIGILTIKEKWEHRVNTTISYLTQDYLQGKYPLIVGDDNLLINSSFFPDVNVVHEIYELKQNQGLYFGEKLIACRVSREGVEKFDIDKTDIYDRKEYEIAAIKINYPWQIFMHNEFAIESDFNLVTSGRISKEISRTNNILGKGNIFVEEGAEIEFATINAEVGPVYIGKNAKILEGALIRGPFALCNDSTVKMGAKIYGPTTIGPYCKVGGEINNSVFTSFSNKAHEGYLGNSVIGEWCNLGADTNNSNLKNNYAEVKVWNYVNRRFIKTGLQFCGLIMGDHSKCAINTMFNTGTVVGVSANIFGEGFPRNFIPSFSWGGASGFQEYGLDKALEVAEIVYKRRDLEFENLDKEIFAEVFRRTEENRAFK